MASLQKIIRFLTFVIIPIGIGIFVSQFYIQNLSIEESIVQTVAAMIGMIPEGLVLLTSTVLAVSVIRLSKSKVLVQDLYCIETLARVDTLWLDKTGTLTEGVMEVSDVIPFDSYSKEDLSNILANIGKFSEDENQTIKAIRNHFCDITEEFIPHNKVAFSSEKKWSGIDFGENNTYIIGAPSFVLKDHPEINVDWIKKYTEDYRVLLIAKSSLPFNDKNLPKKIEPIGIVLLLDKIRKDASKTIKYFDKQGVDIKIISGDDPITVSKLAKRVGLKNYNKYIDMTNIKEEDLNNLEKLVSEYSVFGRVSPTIKKSLVKALKTSGKTVAMTGDGVNDVLALREADCSIAMANGSDATKNISQLVLLNSNFTSIPKIVAEGRRTINNIQRSASLFLVKTIYSMLLSLLTLISSTEYPFIPIQLSLIGVVTIGIPSFLLALEPNNERIQGKFLNNVIKKALPTGILVVLFICIWNFLSHKFLFIPEKNLSSLCVLSTGICGLGLVLSMVKKRKSEEGHLPFSIYRLVIFLSMTALFILGLTYFAPLFNISFEL